MRQLKLYEIKKEYIEYLGMFQEHVFHDEGKRKYVGIILEINGYKYFAPLSSFKEKHKRMKESVDFIKIKDVSVININNMIPVPERQYQLVDISGTKDPHYKYLMQTEIREINKQKNRISKNAQIVYSHKLRNTDKTSLAKRCNDFIVLEKKCREFIK